MFEQFKCFLAWRRPHKWSTFTSKKMQGSSHCRKLGNKDEARPRKDLRDLRFVGGGKSLMAATLIGSTSMPCLEITCPKYSTLYQINLHFFGLRRRPAWSRQSMTCFKWEKVIFKSLVEHYYIDPDSPWPASSEKRWSSKVWLSTIILSM